MPTQNQHINQWKRNRALLLSNALTDYPDWKITVAFYCALHAVEALLAAKSMPRFKDHTGRNAFLGHGNNKLLQVWNSYKPLYDASKDARYACWDARAKYSAPVQKELIQICLQHVEGFVIKTIALSRTEIPLIEVDAATGTIATKPVEISNPAH